MGPDELRARLSKIIDENPDLDIGLIVAVTANDEGYCILGAAKHCVTCIIGNLLTVVLSYPSIHNPMVHAENDLADVKIKGKPN